MIRLLVFLIVITTAIATNKPRSYWRFEDPNAFGTDSTGQHNLTVPNVPTPPYSIQNTTGIVGSYLSLQGSNTSLSVSAQFFLFSSSFLILNTFILIF